MCSKIRISPHTRRERRASTRHFTPTPRTAHRCCRERPREQGRSPVRPARGFVRKPAPPQATAPSSQAPQPGAAPPFSLNPGPVLRSPREQPPLMCAVCRQVRPEHAWTRLPTPSRRIPFATELSYSRRELCADPGERQPATAWPGATPSRPLAAGSRAVRARGRLGRHPGAPHGELTDGSDRAPVGPAVGGEGDGCAPGYVSGDNRPGSGGRESAVS